MNNPMCVKHVITLISYSLTTGTSEVAVQDDGQGPDSGHSESTTSLKPVTEAVDFDDQFPLEDDDAWVRLLQIEILKRSLGGVSRVAILFSIYSEPSKEVFCFKCRMCIVCSNYQNPFYKQ